MNLLHILLAHHEPWVYTKGWVVTLVGFCIVVIALFVLSMIFRGVASYFSKKDAIAKNETPQVAKAKESLAKPVEKAKKADGEISDEVLTAIGMALYLSTNLHDEESNVITITRRQTSWNDKSYAVRHWNH